MKELFFNAAADRYKQGALNTATLVYENLNTLEMADDGVLNVKNVDHVIDEFKWSLSEDVSAKMLLGGNREQYIKKWGS